MKPIVAISMGAPGGIGPEVIVKALGKILAAGGCRPWIFGDPALLSATAARCHKKVVFEISGRPPGRAGRAAVFPFPAVPPEALPPWESGAAAGQLQLDYLKEAARRVLSGEADALCTAPVSKESIRRVEPAFTGQTEYLAGLCGGAEPTMAFYSEKMIVALVTTHLRLSQVAAALTPAMVTRAIVHLGQFLCQALRRKQPRIGVCALNPHGGSDHFGEEEETILAPGIAAAVAQGFSATGPFPADSLFFRASRGEFDAVVAIYHDQGLIPLKLLDFKGAVNLTLGLPLIRTSPDHGTAFDLAGKGRADARSFFNAATLAARLAANRPGRKR